MYTQPFKKADTYTYIVILREERPKDLSLGTARLTGQVISMALVTLILASSTGNVELSPAFSHLFIKAARISFIIFTILSCLGILASLARGKSNNQNQTSA
jgi:hypothetical protein